MPAAKTHPTTHQARPGSRPVGALGAKVKLDLKDDDPETFLKAIMANNDINVRDRVAAAKSLVGFQKAKLSAENRRMGKNASLKAAAPANKYSGLTAVKKAA